MVNVLIYYLLIYTWLPHSPSFLLFLLSLSLPAELFAFKDTWTAVSEVTMSISQCWRRSSLRQDEVSTPSPARLILSLLPQLMGRSKCQRREPGGFYHDRRPLRPDPRSKPGMEISSSQLTIERVTLRVLMVPTNYVHLKEDYLLYCIANQL